VRVSRTDWLDWYVDEALGESAVFVDGRVLALSELATTLLDLVGDGRDLDELAAGLSAAFGPPEGDEVEVTTALVTDLATERVLSIESDT
jgi:hypothetical protein